MLTIHFGVLIGSVVRKYVIYTFQCAIYLFLYCLTCQRFAGAAGPGLEEDTCLF